MQLERTEEECFIFIGNFGCEVYWKENTEFSFRRIKNKAMDAIITNSDLFMSYFCEERDLLVLGNDILPDYSEYLKEITINIPETVVVDDVSGNSITEKILNDELSILHIKQYVEKQKKCGYRVYLVSFAVTYLEEQLAKSLNVPLRFSNCTINKQLNNKFFVRELCSQLGIPITSGGIVQDFNELDEVCATLFQNFQKVVLKEPYGASGLGMLILNKYDMYNFKRSITKKLRDQKIRLLVEGWYDVEESYNQQFLFEREKISFLCQSKQKIVNGLYRGAHFGFQNKYKTDLFTPKIELLLERIKEMGYLGVVGIDSILSSMGTYYPCIEINARFNMSTFVDALRKRLDLSCIISHFWKDIVISKDLHFSQIRYLLKDKEFRLGEKKGIIYFNYIVNSKSEVESNCRIHFLVVGEEDEYVQSTECWVNNMLAQVNHL